MYACYSLLDEINGENKYYLYVLNLFTCEKGVD